MINKEGFRTWLQNNTEFSPRVVTDLVSRMGRADSILNWSDDEVYLFRLCKTEAFQSLSVFVKSQLRRAVTLYSAYAFSSNHCSKKKA